MATSPVAVSLTGGCAQAMTENESQFIAHVPSTADKQPRSMENVLRMGGVDGRGQTIFAQFRVYFILNVEGT